MGIFQEFRDTKHRADVPLRKPTSPMATMVSKPGGNRPILRSLTFWTVERNPWRFRPTAGIVGKRLGLSLIASSAQKNSPVREKMKLPFVLEDNEPSFVYKLKSRFFFPFCRDGILSSSSCGAAARLRRFPFSKILHELPRDRFG